MYVKKLFKLLRSYIYIYIYIYNSLFYLLMLTICPLNFSLFFYFILFTFELILIRDIQLIDFYVFNFVKASTFKNKYKNVFTRT